MMKGNSGWRRSAPLGLSEPTRTVRPGADSLDGGVAAVACARCGYHRCACEADETQRACVEQAAPVGALDAGRLERAREAARQARARVAAMRIGAHSATGLLAHLVAQASSGEIGAPVPCADCGRYSGCECLDEWFEEYCAGDDVVRAVEAPRLAPLGFGPMQTLAPASYFTFFAQPSRTCELRRLDIYTPGEDDGLQWLAVTALRIGDQALDVAGSDCIAASVSGVEPRAVILCNQPVRVVLRNDAARALDVAVGGVVALASKGGR